jgi:hypothetical protein
VSKVQRNASRPDPDQLAPTTVDPSADTALARLKYVPPGRSPSPRNTGPAKTGIDVIKTPNVAAVSMSGYR